MWEQPKRAKERTYPARADVYILGERKAESMAHPLKSPEDAAHKLADMLERQWANLAVAELSGGEHGFSAGLEVRLRPASVGANALYDRVGASAVQTWRETWAHAELPKGCDVEQAPLAAGLVPDPLRLRVADFSAAARFMIEHLPGAAPMLPRYDAALALARELQEVGAVVTAPTLRAAMKQTRDDQKVLLALVGWLADHADLSGLLVTQLPIAEMQTKWLTTTRNTLVKNLIGRDVLAEVQSRPTVIHFTYLDSTHLADARNRRHDSWTAGDRHHPAYDPTTVIIVENRDSRLTFPPVKNAIAVEGGGNAASALLEQIPWLLEADTIAYWGDIDADGFAILNRLRESFATLDPSIHVTSILMDSSTLHEFAALATSVDRQGKPIKPRGGPLPLLTEAENAAYVIVSTGGDTPVRRIEQEKLPPARAARALTRLAGIASAPSQAGDPGIT